MNNKTEAVNSLTGVVGVSSQVCNSANLNACGPISGQPRCESHCAMLYKLVNKARERQDLLNELRNSARSSCNATTRQPGAMPEPGTCTHIPPLGERPWMHVSCPVIVGKFFNWLWQKQLLIRPASLVLGKVLTSVIFVGLLFSIQLDLYVDLSITQNTNVFVFVCFVFLHAGPTDELPSPVPSGCVPIVNSWLRQCRQHMKTDNSHLHLQRDFFANFPSRNNEHYIHVTVQW